MSMIRRLCCVYLVSTMTLYSQSIPPAPHSDIPWSGSGTGVVLIASAYSNARSAENSQLGLSLPTAVTLPDQTTWDGMTVSERALLLINNERAVRGLLPFQGVDANVLSVVQAYAETLAVKQILSHTADGRTFGERLNNVPELNGHYGVAGENLAAISAALGIERAVYIWLYQDDAATWLHRANCLYSPLSNNHGDSSSEGLMAVGRATGGTSIAYIVYNFVDPTADYLVSVGRSAPGVPPAFVLGQNYPNPFNPVTTISYRLPRESHVALTVFNCIGQEVAELVNEEQSAGVKSILFDGSMLSSGVYFYKLVAGEFTATKKLILIR